MPTVMLYNKYTKCLCRGVISSLGYSSPQDRKYSNTSGYLQQAECPVPHCALCCGLTSPVRVFLRSNWLGRGHLQFAAAAAAAHRSTEDRKEKERASTSTVSPLIELLFLLLLIVAQAWLPTRYVMCMVWKRNLKNLNIIIVEHVFLHSQFKKKTFVIVVLMQVITQITVRHHRAHTGWINVASTSFSIQLLWANVELAGNIRWIDVCAKWVHSYRWVLCLSNPLW